VEQGETLAVVRMEQKVSLETAVQAVSLSNVIKNTNEDLVISGLASLILRTAGFFNIGRPMTEEQAIETAYLLLEKYPHESLEDFVIMFRNAKLGKYGDGKLYNRLDGMIIFGWMSEYMEEKAAYREKLHQALKFGQAEENLLETIQTKALELHSTESIEKSKSVVDAIKEAIDFKWMENNEKDYIAFRNKFFTKNQESE
jgi:hypothetical protein